jgi:hypothetical protein
MNALSRRLPLLLASLISSALCSQDEQARADSLPPDAPAAMSVIDQKTLRTHVEYLASDELAGRYTGSAGQVKAAEYIKEHFEKLKLLPLGDKVRGKRSFFQRYTLERTYLDPKKTSISFGQTAYKEGFAVIPGNNFKAVRASGRFLYCGTGNPAGLPKSLRRVIPVVVLNSTSGGPRASMRGGRQVNRARDVNRELASRGAKLAVFLIITENSSLMDSMNTRVLLPEQHVLTNPSQRRGRGMESHRIPSVFLPPKKSAELLAYLGYQVANGTVEQTKANKKASGKVYLQVRQDKKFQVLNVCALLEGSSKKSEALVYSAHMDHVGIRMDSDPFNGADDNASGSAGLLQMATAFSSSKERPKRSVIFLSVSGEELGLWGSLHYSDNPTWPLKKIIANINIDMIGRHTSLSPDDTVSVTPSKDHSKFSTLVREAAKLANSMGMKLSNGDTYYLRSDHYNFARKGIPVVFFCDGEHEDYHQVTDHADKIDFPKMEQIARLAFWTGWKTVNAAKRPRDLGKQSKWIK